MFPGAGRGHGTIFLWRSGLGSRVRFRTRPVCSGAVRFIALSNPILVAAGDDIDLARPIEPERDRHGPVEEVAVVADDQDRALVIGDHLLEQVERFKVEVVGRLVEHQQVRFPREFARQQQPRSLAARTAIRPAPRSATGSNRNSFR